jgi:hypothetical protein
LGFYRGKSEYNLLELKEDVMPQKIDESESLEIDESVRRKPCGFIRNLWAVYDHSVLALLCLNYFNNGAMGMVLMVVVNMYQDEFGIGPG